MIDLTCCFVLKFFSFLPCFPCFHLQIDVLRDSIVQSRHESLLPAARSDACEHTPGSGQRCRPGSTKSSGVCWHRAAIHWPRRSRSGICGEEEETRYLIQRSRTSLILNKDRGVAPILNKTVDGRHAFYLSPCHACTRDITILECGTDWFLMFFRWHISWKQSLCFTTFLTKSSGLSLDTIKTWCRSISKKKMVSILLRFHTDGFEFKLLLHMLTRLKNSTQNIINAFVNIFHWSFHHSSNEEEEKTVKTNINPDYQDANSHRKYSHYWF